MSDLLTKALGRSMRLDELRGEIRMLRSLRIQAYPGGEAEKEIDASIAARRAEIAALESESEGSEKK